MKYFIFSMFLVSALMVINCSAEPKQELQTKPNNQIINTPKLEIVGGDTYDWGKVSPKDNPLHANIVIKNTGNATLEIKEVKAACGCTSAPLNRSTLEPGDTTSLDVTLRLGSSAGDYTKTVRITSNDPVNPNKILVLKTHIFFPIQLSPTSYFTFNVMKVGTEAVSALKLKNNTNETVKLSDFELTPTDLNISIKEGQTLKPGQEIDLIAKYKPSKPGYFNCSLRMKTNSPEMPEIFVSGYGNVQESTIFNN